MRSLPGETLVFGLYVAVFAVASVACVASSRRLRAVDDADTRRGLRALLLTSGGWAAANAAFLALPTLSLKLAAYTVGLVLGFATVGAWLYFCSAYTGRAYHRNPTYRRVAVFVFVVVVAVKVTNPLHAGYFTTTTVATPFPHVAVASGTLHWVAMGLSYALAFVGYFMLLDRFTEVDMDTRALSALLAATALPVVLDVAAVTTPVLVEIGYEPIGVAVFAVGVAYAYIEKFEAVRFAAERDVPTIALDRDGRVRDANRAATTYFPALESARGDPLDAVLPEVAARIDAGEDDVVSVDVDGSTRHYRVTATPYGTGGAGTGHAVVLTDVTDRERYRRELERQNARLESFASVVSHDLRNPLNVAQGELELLRDRLADGAVDEADAVDGLDGIETALDRMNALIDEILALARNGDPVEDPVDVHLSTLATDCWRFVDTGNAELVVADDLAFAGDPDRLKRLFENLIRNACDHAGDDVTLTIGTLADGFYVEDDGPGIPESDRETVFEPGYTTDADGTGFGLAIVAEIADAHGWTVTATESADGGARFEFTGVHVVATETERATTPPDRTTPDLTTDSPPR
ncbi:PAS domain-containing protein [Halorubellus sp. JP-L1]|uniref:sensor histidine kinase n=1 Tax=Halorubellus sp. JP-L1 TaxID=2715753 RepID=UPI0014075EC3|nr:ATP-binding protein [Halorubellus sp. JP-L1]NHN43326.1 PAS domain-containing protein [Halorubellus sp. JP-L1]